MIRAIEITRAGPHQGWDLWDDGRAVGFLNNSGNADKTELIKALYLNNFTQVETIASYQVTPSQWRALVEGPQVRRHGANLDHMGTPKRAGADAAGVWFDGAQGWYNHGRLIREAWRRGMIHDSYDVLILDAYDRVVESITLPNGEHHDHVGDLVIGQGEMMETAEAWLNEHIAPDGYRFGWEEGDFGLWKTDDDEDND